jgi:hypothetical protein
VTRNDKNFSVRVNKTQDFNLAVSVCSDASGKVLVWDVPSMSDVADSDAAIREFSTSKNGVTGIAIGLRHLLTATLKSVTVRDFWTTPDPAVETSPVETSRADLTPTEPQIK